MQYIFPVIASGGAGTKEHFYEALTEGHADAALAASLFHYKELTISRGEGLILPNVNVDRSEERESEKMAAISE